MMLLYVTDVALTVIVVGLEADVLKFVTTDSTKGFQLYNQKISTIVLVVHLIGLLAGFVAGFYFAVIGKYNIDHNADIQKHRPRHCKDHTRMIYLDARGWLKLAALLIGAISYLTIPYLLAMTQIHTWTLTQDVYTQTVVHNVNTVNTLTILICAFRVAELVLGHAWAVARTSCLTHHKKSDDLVALESS